jgi:hypothetical protein
MHTDKQAQRSTSHHSTAQHKAIYNVSGGRDGVRVMVGVMVGVMTTSRDGHNFRVRVRVRVGARVRVEVGARLQV